MFLQLFATNDREGCEFEINAEYPGFYIPCVPSGGGGGNPCLPCKIDYRILTAHDICKEPINCIFLYNNCPERRCCARITYTLKDKNGVITTATKEVSLAAGQQSYDAYSGFETILSVKVESIPCRGGRSESLTENIFLDNKNVSMQKALKAYPSPSDGFVRFSLPENLAKSEIVKIYNITGQLISKKNVAELNDEEQFFNSGTYIISVMSNGKILSEKFIVN